MEIRKQNYQTYFLRYSFSVGIPLHQLPEQGQNFKMPDGKEITLAKHRYEEAIGT